MIRSLALFKLRPGTDLDAVRKINEGLKSLKIEGMRSMLVGYDLGLRAGNFDYSVTCEFDDEASYRAYDLDPEHGKIRAQMSAYIEVGARIQVPG